LKNREEGIGRGKREEGRGEKEEGKISAYALV
jgi:hypothetical protein